MVSVERRDEPAEGFGKGAGGCSGVEKQGRGGLGILGKWEVEVREWRPEQAKNLLCLATPMVSTTGPLAERRRTWPRGYGSGSKCGRRAHLQ